MRDILNREMLTLNFEKEKYIALSILLCTECDKNYILNIMYNVQPYDEFED